MADITQLETALRNAHAAGDENAARKLAGAIMEQRKTAPPKSIEIELPDGTIAEFPDDMPHEQIQAVLAKQYPTQQPQPQPDQQPEQLEPPQPVQNPFQPGYSAKDKFLHGATLGASDNIVAGLNTIPEMAAGYFTGEDEGKGFSDRVSDAYNRTAKPYQEGLEQYQQDHPGRSLFASLGGGLFSGAGLAKVGATTASFIPKALKNSTSLMGRTGSASATGAAATADGALLGGGYAFNEGQNVSDNMLMGGVTGLAGAVAAPILQGAGKKLANAVRTFTAKPDAQAARMVMDSLRRSGMTDEAVTQKMSELGADGFLVDTMGAGGQSLSRSAANVSPVAREALETASYSRQAGQTERLSQSLEKAAGLSTRQTPDEIISGIRDRLSPQIDEAYATARAAGHSMPTEPFAPLMKSHAVQQALKRGKALANERQIAKGGTNNPSALSTFDEAKKFLDAQAVPDLGKPQNNEQAIAGMLSKRLRETVDANVPQYGGARSLAQNATNTENAVRLGVEGSKSKVPVDYGRRVQSASNHSDAIGKGFASAKVQELLNARSTAGVTDRFFGNPQQVAAMRAALGWQADDVAKQIANERTFNATHKALTGNSTTARQLSEMLQFGGGAGLGGGLGAGYGYATGNDPLTSAAAGAAIGLSGRGASKAWKGMAMRRNEAIAPHLAKALLGRKLPASLNAGKAKHYQSMDALRLMITSGSIANAGAM